MTRTSASLRHRRLARSAAGVVVAVLATLIIALPGSAFPWAPAVPAPPANPTSADQIQNIDQVKTAIMAYYGDTTFTAPDPVNPSTTTTLHTFSPTGAYANEMAGLEAQADHYLDDAVTGPKGPPPHYGPLPHHGPPSPPGPPAASGTPAIVLDVDDTTLNTYMYEIYSNFVYNPTSNAAFVNADIFPAVPGMPALAALAKADGYQVFFLTGRPESQRAATVANLATAGYGTVANDHLYLKDLYEPWLSSCATTTPACSTTQYKSLTRQHIESLGYDIVANFGDQFSDLNGGFADKTFKLPNPMYFLP